MGRGSGPTQNNGVWKIRMDIFVKTFFWEVQGGKRVGGRDLYQNITENNAVESLYLQIKSVCIKSEWMFCGCYVVTLVHITGLSQPPAKCACKHGTRCIRYSR